MPSPVGHTIAGLCGFTLVHPQVAVRHRLSLLFVSVLIANLPDIDLLFGLLLRGNLGVFHRQATHSLIVAASIGIIVTLFAKRRRLRPWGIWVAGLYGSHILLDMLMDDRHYPYGLQALWPLSQRYFISPITFFTRLSIQEILSFTNVATVMREISLLVPFLWLAWHWSKRWPSSVNLRKFRQTHRSF